MAVNSEDITLGVRALGLSGRVVCLHTSLRSFGSPTPDADMVIDAFLDEACTVLVPTFSHGEYGLRPVDGMRPARNGTDYTDSSWWPDVHDRIFQPSSAIANETMGALPRALLLRSERIRGDHPIASFSALGPLAAELVSGQSWSDVYAPLEALAARDAAVLLVGVGLTCMTLLHLAEQHAGRNLFRRWVNAPDGRPTLVESGGCSEGFDAFANVLAPIRTELTVGRSRWQHLPAAGTLARAAEAIVRDPSITHCGLICARCDDAVAGGPVL